MLLLLLACQDPAKESDTTTTVPVEAPGMLGFSNPHARNLIVIQVDTWRADHLSAYGYARETLPITMLRPWRRVDGLMAASSWTPLATASVMTGLEVHHHGLLAFQDGQVRDPVTAPTLGEAFAAAGFRTGLYVGNTFVVSSTGIGRGFEQVYLDPERSGVSNLGKLVDGALSWVDNGKGPFFLFFQPMDMHEPYSPEMQDRGTWAPTDVPFDEDANHQEDALSALWEAGDAAAREELTRTVTAVYDEQTLGLDRSIDRLLTALEKRGLLEETLVVLTADHGETLNDDGLGTFGHGESLRQETLRVPLFFLYPTVPEGSVECPAMGVDLAPTLLELMHLPEMSGIDGHSLQQACRESSRASLFTPDDLWMITAATPRQRISRDCYSSVESVWDLEADPGAGLARPPEELPDTVQLREELNAYTEEILSSLPGKTCNYTGPG